MSNHPRLLKSITLLITESIPSIRLRFCIVSPIKKRVVESGGLGLAIKYETDY